MKGRNCFFLRRSGALLLPVVTCFFVGCVPLNQLPPEMQAAAVSPQAPAAYGNLDPGAISVTTLHFVVRGYADDQMRTVSQLAESLYNKIGNDTGLYSFLAGKTLNIILYRDIDEYARKTSQPAGVKIISANDTIYMFTDTDNAALLAHELCHVILRSYLAGQSTSLRWLMEGVAMMEESAQMQTADKNLYLQSKQDHLRQGPMPFMQMTFANPINEDGRRTDLWFQQVDSVVTFLITQGSSLSFANFLGELRSGNDIDRALQDNYPTRFRSLNELETLWKNTL